MGSNRIVVLTAMPLEAAAVRAHLPPPARHDLPAGTIVEEAALPDTEYNVCLVCTGPGNGQAAVVAERVINWADPAAVLFVGIAGALKGDMALGDVVAATRVLGFHGGKETAAGFKTRPEAWDGAHRLLQVAQYVEAKASWLKFLPDDDAHAAPSVHFKPIASGDVVKDTNDSPLAALLNTNYNDAVAIEMEAAGVARAAHHTAVELLVIRGISDRSDGSKASSDDGGWQPRAARHAAAFALGVIAALPAPGPSGGSAPAHGAATAHGPAAAPDWSVLDQAPAVSWRSAAHRPAQHLGGAAQNRRRARRDLRPGVHRHTPHHAARSAAHRPGPAAGADRPGRWDRARDAGHPRHGEHAAPRRRHDQDERPARAHRSHRRGQRRRTAPRGRPSGRGASGASGPGIWRLAPMNASMRDQEQARWRRSAGGA